MPNLQIVPTEKIELLRRRQPVCQVVAIYWPYGARYYGFFPVDQWPDYAGIPLKPVEPRLVMDRPKRPFLTIKRTAKLQDDVVSLRFVNKSARYPESMRSLFKAAGENVPAEVFLWFPQSEYLHSEFTGHLRNPKRSDQFFLNVELVAGFRSPFYIVPSNAAGYAGCVAKFGGECTSYAELAKTPCKYDRQLSGAVGNLGSDGLPIKSCPKNSEAVCAEVIGNKRYYYGITTSKDTAYVGNGQHKTLSRVDAQQSRIKTAVPVPYGECKAEQLLLLAFTKEVNPNPDNADKGSIRHLHLIGEGPIQSATEPEVDGSTFTRPTEVRLGEPLQAPTTFSQNVGNFNLRAHIRFDRNPINPANTDPRSTNLAMKLVGRNTLSVLQADSSTIEQYDNRTSVVLRDAITSERYGWKLPANRLVNDEWLYLQDWDNDQVKYRDAAGAEYTTRRNEYNGLMQGRPVAQQFDDLCLSASYTRVFWAGGKLHCLPLDKEVLDNTIPTFYATGPQANIAKYGRDSQLRGAPQIQILERSKEDAPLVVEIVYFDKEYGWEKRLLRFEDEDGLKKARANSADTSGLEEPKTYLLSGVTDFGQAVRAGIRLLYLGEFNLGGRKSNLGLQLKIARCTPESLGLHQWQLARVVWDELADEREEDGTPIEYFYVESIEPDTDLQTTVTLWAYPRKTIERLYDITQPPPMNGAQTVLPPAVPDTPPLVPLEE